MRTQHLVCLCHTGFRRLWWMFVILALLSRGPSAGASVLLHLTFDGLSGGTNLIDSGPLTNTVTMIGSNYSIVGGITNNALNMHGATNVARVMPSAQLNLNFTNGFTIQCWFKPAISWDVSGLRKTIVSRKYDTSANGYRLEYYPSYRCFSFEFSTGTNAVTINSCAAPIALNSNTWYHIAVVGKDATLSYYLNGVCFYTKTNVVGNIAPSGDYLRIGSYASTPGTVAPFFGALDDLWIKNDTNNDFSNITNLAPDKIVSYQTLYRMTIPATLPTNRPFVFVTTQELAQVKAAYAANDGYTTSVVYRIRTNAQAYLTQTIDFTARQDIAPIASLAEIYAVTGDTNYGNRARVLLTNFSAYYQTLTTTTNHGRYTSDTLYEKPVAITCAMAYDLIAAAPFVTANDHQQIQAMFRTMAWECGHNCTHTGSDNWRSLANALIAACGFAIGDRGLIDEAINGVYDNERGVYLYGMVQQLTHSFFPDGISWERAPGYSFMSIDAMMYVLVAAKNAGLNIWSASLPGIPGPFLGYAGHGGFNSCNRSVKTVIDSQFYYAFHNLSNQSRLGRIEAYADSCNDQLWYHDIYRLASQEYGDSKYAWLNTCQGRPLDFWNLAHGPTNMPSGSFNMNDPASIGLTGQHTNGCTLFPDGGFAVLRSNPTNLQATSCLLTFGPLSSGHTHPDILHFSLYGQGEIVCPDSGLHPYADPLHTNWDQQTIAHNTIVVDQTSHNYACQLIGGVWRFFEPVGRAQSFDPGNPVKTARATCTNAYAGVTMDRTLTLMNGPYVLDIFRVTSASNRTFDLALHGRGVIQTTPELTATNNTFTQAGYKELTDLRRGTPAAGILRAVFAETNRSVLVLREQPAGSEAITGKDPGGAYYQVTNNFCLISRQCTNQAVFVTLMEPYTNAPLVQSLAVEHQAQGVLQVTVTRQTGEDFYTIFTNGTIYATTSRTVKHTGQAWSWGANGTGELGNGNNTDTNRPVQVLGMSNAIAIAGRAALRTNRTDWVWGNNTLGQLGIGNNTSTNRPTQVLGVSNVLAASGIGNHSLVVRLDGTVWAAGTNLYGQLGIGNYVATNRLTQVSNISNAIAASAGFQHSLVARLDGTAWAWGRNYYGQLGIGSSVGFVNTPTQVSRLTGVSDVSAGMYFSMALKSDGTVWTWGYNDCGQLGNGTTVGTNAPIQVSGLTGARAISAGMYHSLALLTNGTVWAWGYNYYGQLGIGNNVSTNRPVQVVGLSNVTAISAGSSHSMALKSDGTVWTWGYNGSGQLGNGNNINTNRPGQVVNLTNVFAIAAGGSSSFALERLDGIVGEGFYGGAYAGKKTDAFNASVEEYGTRPIARATQAMPDAIAGNAAASLAIAGASTAIITQPADRTVLEGTDATFSLIAAGSGPLSYRWACNAGGVWKDIAGAIAPDYTLKACNALDSGMRLRCVVAGPGGAVASDEVELSVEETPWQSAGADAGGVCAYYDWTAYTMGYNFTPWRDGRILRLGGCFNGTNLVSLWNTADGALLAEAWVAATNDWGYTILPEPVPVKARTKYTVAVTLDRGAGSYRSGLNLPVSHADILVEESVYNYSASGMRVFPLYSALDYMCGQADVTFVRNGPLNNTAPEILDGAPPEATVNVEWEYQVVARDADGDTINYSFDSAPEGMRIDANTGLIRWLPDSRQVGSRTLTVSAADFSGAEDETQLIVDVNPSPE